LAAGDGDQDGTGEGGTREWYGDSAYGTGDLRGAIDDAGHDAVIKPKPLQAPVEGGFTVDEQAGTGGVPGRSHPPAKPDPGGQLRCPVSWVSSA
jgi:hypothetical protein